MRRSLVLGDETAHHPFLQSLPPHVRSGRKPVMRSMAQQAPTEPFWARVLPQGAPITAADLRMFLMAYCACFLAVSAFIW